MRNIFAIIIMAMVAFFVLFTHNEAEAKSRKCTCTSAQGTMVHGCPYHGNKCIGLPRHEHERTRGRSVSLPIFCEYDGIGYLTHEPSCKVFRSKARTLEIQERRAIREREREQRLAQRERERQYRNSPLGIFQEEFNRRSDSYIRRGARDAARDIFRGIFR